MGGVFQFSVDSILISIGFPAARGYVDYDKESSETDIVSGTFLDLGLKLDMISAGPDQQPLFHHIV